MNCHFRDAALIYDVAKSMLLRNRCSREPDAIAVTGGSRSGARRERRDADTLPETIKKTAGNAVIAQ
jgi:hypothetical protein